MAELRRRGPVDGAVVDHRSTDGAVVAVRNIYVLGTIQPSDAVVRVSGKRVRVKEGAFKQPVALHRRVTHIRIVASATGYARSTTWVTVHYAPNRAVTLDSSASGSSQTASGGTATGGGAYTGEEAGFVAGCADSGGSADGCECLWKQLVRQGFETEAQWKKVAEGWHASFLANGTITYPPAIKHAILACASRLRG